MSWSRRFAAGAFLVVTLILAGCTDRPPAVPGNASLMTEGNGVVTFRPTEFGRVYVSDQTEDKILYQAEVERGDVVEVDSRDNRIRVAGRTVSERDMDDGHNYRIFFEPLDKARVVRYRVVEEEVRPAR